LGLGRWSKGDDGRREIELLVEFVVRGGSAFLPVGELAFAELTEERNGDPRSHACHDLAGLTVDLFRNRSRMDPHAVGDYSAALAARHAGPYGMPLADFRDERPGLVSRDLNGSLVLTMSHTRRAVTEVVIIRAQ
jgi:hypothetical protein